MLHDRGSGLGFAASVQRRAALDDLKRLSTQYKVVCRGPDGKIKWTDEFKNLVVTAGLNDSLDKHLKGSAYTAAWYIGLTDGTPTPAAGDTMASHVGWTEVQAYDEAVKEDLTLGAVSGGSVDNMGNEAVFTIDTNSTTIGGCFICDNATKGGATGILYGVGAFTAGDKTLDDNDTLTVTVTCTATAS